MPLLNKFNLALRKPLGNRDMYTLLSLLLHNWPISNSFECSLRWFSHDQAANFKLVNCPPLFRTASVTIEEVQREFARKLRGPTSSLSCREPPALIHLDPLWLCRVNLNLIFLFKLPRWQARTAGLLTSLLIPPKIDRHPLLYHHSQCFSIQNSLKLSALFYEMGF